MVIPVLIITFVWDLLEDCVVKVLLPFHSCWAWVGQVSVGSMKLSELGTFQQDVVRCLLRSASHTGCWGTEAPAVHTGPKPPTQVWRQFRVTQSLQGRSGGMVMPGGMVNSVVTTVVGSDRSFTPLENPNHYSVSFRTHLTTTKAHFFKNL